MAEFDLDGTEEIKRWVLSFGKEAVVVEPEGLMCEIRNELLALLELTEVDANESRKIMSGKQQ